MAKLCPHCSVDVAEDAKACWHCHSPLEPGQAPAAAAPPQAPRPAPAAAAPGPGDGSPLKPGYYQDLKRALLVEAGLLVLGLVLWPTHLMVLLGAPLFLAITVTLTLLAARWARTRPELNGGFLRAAAFIGLMLLVLPVAAAIAFCCACLPMWSQLGGL